MTESLDSQSRDLFVAALDLSPEERRDFFAAHCTDPVLRAEIESLLRSHDRLGDFLLASKPEVSCFPGLSILPGTQFGDFEIVAYHAHGGRGVVYRARQRSLGDREVALKVVPMLRVSDDKDSGRLRREADLAARVEHRHLVAIYGAGEAPELGLAWYAMRFVSGPTLHAVLENFVDRGSAPTTAERRALVLRVAEICRAAGALHAAGLVHGDIKPSNVLLEGSVDESASSAPAVLVDFGLARVANTSSPSTLAATPAYAAPERVRGGGLHPRVDVFALGVSLYDLLRGELPNSRAAYAPEWCPSLVSVGVDRELASIVQRATCADPSRRHANGSELASDLDHWLAGTRRGTRRTRPMESMIRSLRRDPLATRRRARTLSVAVAALLIAVIASIAFLRVASMRSAFHLGDFVTFLDVASRWSWLSHLAPQGSASTQDVLDVLARDRHEGRRRAASWIDRDGPRAHPELVRFLASEVRLSSGDESTGRLVALLGVDHPARDASSRAAYSPLTVALRAQLARPASELASNYSASALGSLGDLSDVPRLLDAAMDFANQGDVGLEVGRTAIEAASALLRVTTASRPTAPPRGLLGPVVATGRDDAGADLVSAWSTACERLAVEWALASRRAGTLPGTTDQLGRFALRESIRAAFCDEDLLTQVLLDGPALRTLVVTEPRTIDVERAWNVFRFGRLIGTYDRADVLPEARAAVTRASAEVLFDADRALKLFERGYEIARRHLAGQLDEDEPDADTRLRQSLDPESVTRPEFRSAPRPSRSLLAADFSRRPITCSAEETKLRLVNVVLEDDEVELRSGFAKLSLPGRSAIELEFECATSLGGTTWLHLSVQKGLRARQLHRGHAAVDVILDGVTVLPKLATPSSARGDLELPITRHLERGPHRLTLRLAADSDTTLRVFAVAAFHN